VIKTVTVRAEPLQAFRRFTEGIGGWWPLASHSVGQKNAETVVFECRVGGRIVERIRGGRESVWGTVTSWDPPRRVAFTWHPGQNPETAQDIDVRFDADGAGTRVTLTHRGFERLGKKARLAHRGYPIGWAYVLGHYTQRGGPFMALVGGMTAVVMGVERVRSAFTRK
jgi:uncharacterized protein YndB with AHSA1/START domain